MGMYFCVHRPETIFQGFTFKLNNGRQPQNGRYPGQLLEVQESLVTDTEPYYCDDDRDLSFLTKLYTFKHVSITVSLLEATILSYK